MCVLGGACAHASSHSTHVNMRPGHQVIVQSVPWPPVQTWNHSSISKCNLTSALPICGVCLQSCMLQA